MYQNMISLPDFTHSPVDIHSHFNHGAKADCPEDNIHLRGMDFMESVYRNSGVTQVGVSTYASVLDTGYIPEENEYLHHLIDEKAWVYQWVVVDPRQKDTYVQAEKMLSHPKVLGIKLQPQSHGYDILDYAEELFAFAHHHRTVLLVHPQKRSDRLAAFANKYPDMKLIIAHLGAEDHIKAVANAVHGNIYVDTSGAASSRNNVIEYAVQRIGSEKILFGTDTYAYPFQFGRIALSGLSFEEKENILWRNAVRLFPNAFR
jgi:predicted TIM-barrel fold metal-dependent hydrolase